MCGYYDHGDRSDFGFELSSPLKLPAIHLRHQEVEKDQANPNGPLAQASEGLLSIARDDREVAFLFQYPANHLADFLIVVDDEHRRRSGNANAFAT